MGAIRHPINAQTFAHYKTLNKHEWTWLGKTKHVPRFGQYYAHCECRCGRKAWVLWIYLRNGKSTQCKGCTSRRHDLAPYQQKLDAHGSTLQITEHVRKTAKKRREYLCRCRGCKKVLWVRWDNINRGRANCRSCATKKAHGVFVSDMPPWKRSLWLAWYSFSWKGSRRAKKGATHSWKTFEEFVHWSINAGYEHGHKLITTRKKETHYSPETCRWVPTRFTEKLRTARDYDRNRAAESAHLVSRASMHRAA